jgi:hypothetical protein
VTQNKELRGILGPKKAEVTGDCRKLHNEEFLYFANPLFTKYYMDHQITTDRMGQVECMVTVKR